MTTECRVRLISSWINCQLAAALDESEIGPVGAGQRSFAVDAPLKARMAVHGREQQGQASVRIHCADHKTMSYAGL